MPRPPGSNAPSPSLSPESWCLSPAQPPESSIPAEHLGSELPVQARMDFQGKNWENGEGTERGPGSSQAGFLQEERPPVISGNCDSSAGAWRPLTRVEHPAVTVNCPHPSFQRDTAGLVWSLRVWHLGVPVQPPVRPPCSQGPVAQQAGSPSKSCNLERKGSQPFTPPASRGGPPWGQFSPDNQWHHSGKLAPGEALISPHLHSHSNRKWTCIASSARASPRRASSGSAR